jgi:hypothetical protein
VKRRLFELLLGVRMSVAGGRSSWSRLALIAVGVGLGVAVLLGAATLPGALAVTADRDQSRSSDASEEVPRGDDTLLVGRLNAKYRGEGIFARAVQPEGDRPPLPPGVSRLPGPRQMVASPALAELLTSPEGAMLRDRWDAEVVGIIGDEGVTGPAELAVYLGTDTLTADNGVRIRAFGDGYESDGGVPPMLVLVTLVGMVVLLMPVVVFMSSAVRFGGEARDRRLAALRLVGADAAMTRRFAAGETLAGALLGLAVGAALWTVSAFLIFRYGSGKFSFFLADLRPVPLLAVIVAVGVPAVAVLVTLSAMRRVVVEPLGVTRMSTPVRRRLWWRLILPVIGLALMWPLTRGLDGTINEFQIVAGLAFLLSGIALLLPWLVEAVVRRLGGGPLPWELAVRRLQFDSGTAIRAVSGIAVSVAGVIAMQGVISGIESQYNRRDGGNVTYQAYVLPGADLPEATWTTALNDTPGVRETRTVHSVQAGDDVQVRVADCTVLRQLAEVGDCQDGDAYALDGAAADTSYRLGDTGAAWTPPATTRSVTSDQESPSYGKTLLATPGALAGVTYEPDSTSFYIAVDNTEPDAIDLISNTAAGVDLLAYTATWQNQNVVDVLAGLRQGILVGAIALLVLIGASMIVNGGEQLRERRRVLAALIAVGIRRRTLTGSIFYQVAVPVILGMLLAVTVGSALAAALMLAVGTTPRVDWVGIGVTTSIATLVVLLTTAAGLPTLWRLTRPANLRSE